MKNIIQEVNYLLIQKKKTLAVAESCTGGEVSKLLTEIKGSSQYFILGIVAYSNFAKEKILKIPSKVIQKEGPVAEKTTQMLASAVRKLALTDIGIGITCIAGPGGSLAGKPKGTVFIAIETENKSFCKRFLFKGSRTTVRKKASLKTLELLRKVLD
jgi:PncC family amidohydrolase